MNPALKTSWFTFGQGHIHWIGDLAFNKNTVVEVTAADPWTVMFALFGRRWSMQSDILPDMSFYPDGVIKITIEEQQMDVI